jgi:hypothetical protein
MALLAQATQNVQGVAIMEAEELLKLSKQCLCSLTDLIAELVFFETKDPTVLADCEEAFSEILASNDILKIHNSTMLSRNLIKGLAFSFMAKGKTNEFNTIHSRWKEKYSDLAKITSGITH